MREWVVSLVGEGMAPVVTMIVAAAIVVLLLLIVIWVARKALGGTMGPRAKGRGPRLAVMDIAIVDQKRKLVLVRRDEVEHLLLIGGQNDLVVEPGITRVPATSRPQRLEPSLRPEQEAIERNAAPAAIASPRQPLAAPQRAAEPVAVPSQTMRPAAPARPQNSPEQRPENRVASPLTRTVPRPPVTAPAPEPELAPEPAIEPERQAPTVDAVELPSPRPSAEPRAAAEQAPNRVAAVTAGFRQPPALGTSPQPDVAPLPIAAPQTASPEVDSTVSPQPRPYELGVDAPRERDPVAPVVTPPVPVVVADRASAPAPAPARDVPPVAAIDPEPTIPAGVAETTAPLPMPARTPRVDPEPRPLPRQLIGQGTQPDRVTPQRIEPAGPEADRPSAPMTRVSVSGSGEPARRPPAPFVPPLLTPRSMATPTYPVKPTAINEEADEPLANPGDDDRTRDEPSLAGPAQREPVAPPAPREEKPAAAPEISPPPVFASRPTTSPLIAAAERQKEAILARGPVVPERKAPIVPSAPVRPAEPLLPRSAAPATAAAQTPEPAASVPASSPVIATEPPASPEPEAPRPLSVRSFATAIQSMKPSYEPAPLKTTPAAARVQPVSPAMFGRVPAPVAAPKVEAKAEPVPPNSFESDDTASLEDFLSAELDSDFGKVVWNEAPGAAASAAPSVRVDPVTARTPESRVKPEQPADAPRTLTIEEEMERLLGDFDFEISDRKAK